ncbi:hypothetical protein QAD02_013174 [Eretmocerus hayati]|uniref:Uncharacterized protein n=1 Tax=Eretmocerus hayati TaxID=131215 RepID=A0ACC2P1Y5_9HYME|nr:hypothetical protein QAD02_013174 [Eretmocerus hayati]
MDRACCSTIEGTFDDEGEGCTTIEFIIKNFQRGLVHEKKLPLSGELRATAQNALRALKPISYQHKLANDLLGSDSDDDCPLVASTEVYSKVRREAKDKDLQIEHLAKDPMTAMIMMKLENPSIRDISTYPSSVGFSSQLQIDFWNLVLMYLHGQVLIDATGGGPNIFEIVKGLTCSDIFFYNIVTSIGDGKVHSLCQSLSSAHDGRTIYLWIRNWIMSGTGIPREAVLDGSVALVNGVCDAWIKKDFYVRSLSFALKIRTLEEITRSKTVLLIIAQSQTCTPTSKCSAEIKWLDGKIATFTVEQPNGDTCPENVVQYNYIDEDFDNSCLPTEIFVENVLNQSVKLCCNIRAPGLNPYYLPKIVDNLIPLFNQFPAWSNVMNQFHKYASDDPTSARIEAYNKIMKRDYGLKAPIAVHRFLEAYCVNVNGATKLGLRELKKRT